MLSLKFLENVSKCPHQFVWGTVGTRWFREVDRKVLGEGKGTSLTWDRLLEGLHAEQMNPLPYLVHKAPIASVWPVLAWVNNGGCGWVSALTSDASCFKELKLVLQSCS